MKKDWKVKVSEKGKKVIFPIIKDVPGFLIPYLQGILRC